MKSVFILFDNIVNLYIWILIINVIMTWLVAFNILNTSNRFVYSVLDVSHKLTDPPLNFIRRYLPNLGSIDISPIILILGLMFLRNLVFEMFAPSGISSSAKMASMGHSGSHSAQSMHSSGCMTRKLGPS